MTDKPSAGALRAAQFIYDEVEDYLPDINLRGEWARRIDRETHVKELVEALKAFLEWDDPNQDARMPFKQARAALKAAGEL